MELKEFEMESKKERKTEEGERKGLGEARGHVNLGKM